MQTLAETFTITVNGGIFRTPAGATEICVNNRGGAVATVLGSAQKVTVINDAGEEITATANPIEIPVDLSFTFGYVGRGRKSMTINATGTVVDVEITL